MFLPWSAAVRWILAGRWMEGREAHGDMPFACHLICVSRATNMSILSHIDEEASPITIDHKRDTQFYDEDVKLVTRVPCGASPVRAPGQNVSERSCHRSEACLASNKESTTYLQWLKL